MAFILSEGLCLRLVVTALLGAERNYSILLWGADEGSILLALSLTAAVINSTAAIIGHIWDFGSPCFPSIGILRSAIQIPNINACGTTQPPTRIGVVPASPLPIMGPKFKICPLYTLSWKPLSVWQFAVVGNGWKLSSDFSHIFASILKIASHPPCRAEENSESESA